MQGILLVDKPKDWTSFDVVNYVRKMVAQHEGKKPRNVRVGHTGTLDPQATGLLVLLVGKAYTRRAEEFVKLDKIYDVTMKLGETSTTGDAEGDKTSVSAHVPSLDDIEQALQQFTGDLQQMPPAFSAIKIDGQRAYKLAREGKEVTLEPRPIHIAQNVLHEYTYPFVHFTSDVSSGTYIRSLVEDIGKTLTTGAYMSDLRRTRIGDFALTDAVPVQDLSLDLLQQHLRPD